MKIDGSASRTITLALEPAEAAAPVRGATASGKAADRAPSSSSSSSSSDRGEERKHRTRRPSGLSDADRKL